MVRDRLPFTIKKLKMWKDPGYTEECVEVPPVGSWLMPAADYENTQDLRPRKYATLTQIELPISFSECWDMSYLYMEAEDDGGEVKVFGWIRGIERTATAEEAVRISWVPDYWRSFAASLTFGRGTVTKTSKATYERPMRIQPRLWLVNSRELLGDATGTAPNWDAVNYIILARIKTENSITSVEYLHWQVGQANTPSLADVFNGKLDEDLGLDPQEIIGVWISPVGPASYAGTYTHGTYSVSIAGTTVQGTVSHVLQTPIKVDSAHRIIISDYLGAPLGEVPWGFTLTGWVCRLDYGTTGCNIIVDLQTQEGTAPEEGLRLTLPAFSLPVTSNAWSTYNYSGQREYDKRIREINKNQKAVDGITGSATSAISGALTGALIGAAGGPIGAAAGAAIGLGTSLLGAGIGYATQGGFDDALQAASDKLYSNQSNSLLLSAGGIAWYNIGNKGYNVVFLEPDTVSKLEIDNFIAINGYDTEIPTANTGAFLDGGPVQIKDLQITGPVPPAAKTAIKNKLEAGVYIIENNSGGANP